MISMSALSTSSPASLSHDLEAALRDALRTLEQQPREVPEVPDGWPTRALHALAAEDAQAIAACAMEIVVAHSQYRATFDVKGWLFDLRRLTIWADK